MWTNHDNGQQSIANNHLDPLPNRHQNDTEEGDDAYRGCSEDVLVNPTSAFSLPDIHFHQMRIPMPAQTDQDLEHDVQTSGRKLVAPVIMARSSSSRSNVEQDGVGRDDNDTCFIYAPGESRARMSKLARDELAIRVAAHLPCTESRARTIISNGLRTFTTRETLNLQHEEKEVYSPAIKKLHNAAKAIERARRDRRLYGS